MVACPAAAVLVAAMLVVLAPVPANAGPPVPAKAEAPSTEDLLARIQALGRDLQSWLRVAHGMSMAGESIEPLRPELEELDLRVEELKRDLALAEANETVESKARMIEMLLWNLRHALELGDARGALPQDALRTGRSEVGASPLDAGFPANDDCEDATPITFGTVTGSTSEATNDGAASCGGSLHSPDVWYRFTAPADGVVLVTTLGSSYDTVLSAYSSCPGVQSSELECNDDAFGLQSRIKLDVSEGEDYLIRVGGFDDAAGDFDLSVRVEAQITGTISDAVTGDPIASNAFARVYDSSGYYQGSANADASGSYTMGGLGSGEYFVTALVSCIAPCSYSYIFELYDDIPCPAGLCDVSSGTPVPATEGAVTSGIDFALDPPSIVNGQVRDLGTGEPVPSALVQLYDDEGGFAQDDFTDADGRYDFGSLVSGTYYVTAGHSWYRGEVFDAIPCEGYPPSCTATDGTPVMVPAATTVSAIDFDLEALGAITGVVSDAASGLPVDGAHVTVKRPDGDSVADGYVRSDGTFRIGGLADGSYLAVATKSGYQTELYDDVWCEAAQCGLSVWCEVRHCELSLGTLIAVTAGAVTPGIDFELTSHPSISGSLTQTGTGAPLASVPVHIYDTAREEVATASTDASGHYKTEPLDEQTYFVLTESSDCMDELYDGVPCEYGCDVLAGTPVITHTGDPTTGIDFVLDCLGAVSGTVTAADGGAPLADVTVELWQSGQSKKYTSTDASGAYLFSGVQPGSCFIATNDDGQYVDELYNDLECFRGPAGGCDPFTGTPVAVSLNANVSGVDFALDRGGAISGSVLSASSGLPLHYIAVRAYDAAGELVGSASTTESGSYEIGGLVTGTYYAVAVTGSTHLGVLYDGMPCPEACDPAAGTPISVTKGMVTTGVDFSLVERGSITGHVTANKDGRPLSSISMKLYHHDGSEAGYASTDSGGAYSFDYVLPGTYFLLANGPDVVDELYEDIPCGWPCQVTLGTTIEVTDATDPVEIDFVLDVTGEVRGSVVAAATGSPIDDVTIRLYDEAGAFKESATSDQDGLFRIGGLDAGTYYAWAYSAVMTPQLFEGIACPWDSCDMASGTPIAVELDQIVTGVHFELLDRGGIEGAVRDAITGGAMQGVGIEVWTADGDTVRTQHSDEYGRYSVSGLPAGTYFVLTRSNDGHLDELYDDIPCPAPPGGCTPNTGTPVEVAPGATTTGIDFELLYVGAAITGIVTDAGTGEPIGGVRVDVWDAATSNLVTSALSSTNGAYLAKWPIYSGEYRVSTDNPWGYLDEIYNDVACPAGSALEGLCDPAAGDPVMLSGNTMTTGIDFSLVGSERISLFDDGFESGGGEAWSSESGAGLRVTNLATHTGDFGLRILVGGSTCFAEDTVELGEQTINGLLTADACTSISTGGGFVVTDGGEALLTAGMEIVLGNGTSVESGGLLTASIDAEMTPYSFVRDDTPAAERSYQAALFIDLDDLYMRWGNEVLDLLEVLSGDGHVIVRVDVVGGSFKMTAMDVSGATHTTSTMPTHPGWNRLVVSWRAAARAHPSLTVNEGSFVDAGPIDTSTLRVDAVRIGVLQTAGSVSGAIAVDDFSSWR